MAFGTKKSVVATPSFSERMAKVLQMQQRILLLSWLITLYFLMRRVKIEFLEAIRFNLNQEMADMIV
jgi:hypothetical protein